MTFVVAPLPAGMEGSGMLVAVRILVGTLVLLAIMAASSTNERLAQAKLANRSLRLESLRDVPIRELETKCSLIFFDDQRVVLRTAADLARHTREPTCLEASSGVDFEQESVLAVELSTGWCGRPLGLQSRLVQDDERKRYVLRIRYIAPDGPCRARSRYDLWIATPTLEDGYAVEFEVSSSESERARSAVPS